ncbi:unnamed protein product, partial [Didymodactylos carnosus]
YQVYNLPRFLGIDYKRNTSLAWHNGDNVMNNCHFGKITFCHVLPPMVFKLGCNEKIEIFVSCQ